MAGNKAVCSTILLLLALTASPAHATTLSLGTGLNWAGAAFTSALASANGVVENLLGNKLNLITPLFKLIPAPVTPGIPGLSGLFGHPMFSLKGNIVEEAASVHAKVAHFNQFLLNLGQDVKAAVCTGPKFVPGDLVPAGCNGKLLTLTITTGECEIDPLDQSITCIPPQVVLDQAPASCNLPYKERCVFIGPQCVPQVKIGVEEEGIIRNFRTKTLDISRSFKLPTLPLVHKFTANLVDSFFNPNVNTTAESGFVNIQKDIPLTKNRASPSVVRSPTAKAASPAVPAQPSPAAEPSPEVMSESPEPESTPSPTSDAAPVVANAEADAVATTP